MNSLKKHFNTHKISKRTLKTDILSIINRKQGHFSQMLSRSHNTHPKNSSFYLKIKTQNFINLFTEFIAAEYKLLLIVIYTIFSVMAFWRSILPFFCYFITLSCYFLYSSLHYIFRGNHKKLKWNFFLKFPSFFSSFR